MRSLFNAAPRLAHAAHHRHHCHAFTTYTRQTARTQSKPSYRPVSSIEDQSRRPSRSESEDERFTRAARQQTQRTYSIFKRLAVSRFDEFLRHCGWSRNPLEYQAYGLKTRQDLDREAKLFRMSIDRACDLASDKHQVSRKDNPLFWSLRNAFVTADVKGLVQELRYAFQSFLMRSRFPHNIRTMHQKIADFRFPYEWYPATRALQRTIHLHVGPTNSGKTYNALKALENAKSGIYAGPLRLLAHEVYTRFQAKGRHCALITGEEQRIPKDADTYFRSCTVEMTPLNQPVDVAVIDEIQMIGDAERGWAWTQAFLGVQAKEVHLCGEERAVDLIQSLCATLGDKCVVTRYKRLSGLETMHESLGGDLGKLEKGDAVVSFSRIGIHTLKKQIENTTGRRAAVVYGSLPPETRAQQAALFNDPNNDYDYLVASDAIGMGLNLEVRRIIFEATSKRDSSSFRPMSVSELKQIGGRAGRYKTAQQAIRDGASSDIEPTGDRSDESKRAPGLVTALEDEDLAVVIKAFNRDPEPLKTAGIQPPVNAIERLSTYFPPNTPLSFILTRLRDICRLSGSYHLCHFKEMLDVADLIQPFPMSIYDRCVFLNAPVALRDAQGSQVVQTLAKCVSTMEGGNLLDIREIELELLDVDWKQTRMGAQEYLQRVESLHKSITLYLWLSYRFSGVFPSQKLAFHVKELVEAKINEYLAGISVSDEQSKRKREAVRRMAQQQELKKKRLLEEEASAMDEPRHEGVGEWNEEGHGEPLYDDPAQLDEITRLEPEPGKDRDTRARR